jgi:3-(methylthio)propanoyl-CoA dehydrogenase
VPAFDVASDAIQVLVGADYTREWPIEQALRDARVFTVYEGTTGIQAIDLVLRRLIRGQRRGLDVFLRTVREDAARSSSAQAAHAETCFDLLEDAAVRLMEAESEDALAGATAFLHLATWAATAWIARRHLNLREETAAARRLRANAAFWLGDVPLRARLVHGMALQKADRLSMIETALLAGN